jgi:hypothetical protein
MYFIMLAVKASITLLQLLKLYDMKKIFIAVLILTAFSVNAQNNPKPTLKSILLEQLKTTHNVKDWFVPPNVAVEGLTAAQANWKDSSDNHSIAQLTTHLLFWNSQMLAKFKNEKPDAFSGNNKETFSPVDEKSWAATVKKLDEVLTEIEKIVENADESALNQMASTIAHIGTHNAYHTGQILYIRKMKGWWNEDNGVK